jgi:hypothetical protein
MGYDIAIGEARIRYHKGDEHIDIDVVHTTHPDAPAHCPYTGIGNSRSPSYTAWSDFCKDAGIYELFYGQGWSRDERRYLGCSEDFHRETPLLSEHPGAFALLPADLEYVRAARIRREQTNGGKPAGFWDYDIERGEIDNGNDHVLARLLWLEFWIDWALKNCEIPTIKNT